MGDVGNNGAYARLRAQATSMRRKAELVGNKLQAIAEGIAKKYGARVTPINYKSVDSIVLKEQKLDTGYSGNIINIRNKKTGLIGEIQVNTAKMIYAKENYSIAYKLLGGKTMREIYKETKKPSGWGHALYEQSRTAKSNGGKKQRSVSMQQAYYATFQ